MACKLPAKRARCVTPAIFDVEVDSLEPARVVARLTPPDLPDEVLVAVLRLVRSAGALWKLRGVCRRWRRVIDAHRDVWRTASFRGALLPRPVILRVCEHPTSPLAVAEHEYDCKRPGPGKDGGGNGTRTYTLELGARHGRGAVVAAAAAGNEWARFLEACLYNACPLKALTVVQPVASGLVHAARRFETREAPPSAAHGWVAVHAARRGPDDMPRGAVVGMVRVSESHQCPDGLWSWAIDRNIALKNPLRCAGYVGLWPLSAHLTEILVRALHTQ